MPKYRVPVMVVFVKFAIVNRETGYYYYPSYMFKTFDEAMAFVQKLISLREKGQEITVEGNLYGAAEGITGQVIGDIEVRMIIS